MWRRRSVLFMEGLAACLLVVVCAAIPASASPSARADQLAALLRRDPVYVTDHAPRALPADAAARVKRSVARLGVRTFVVVTPVTYGEDQGPEELISLLHDRLDRDGIYIVVSPNGSGGEVRQFGTGRTLNADDAWIAADLEMPYDAGAVAVIDRFVEIALSGRARERRDNLRPRPPSRTRISLDAHDRAERRAEQREHLAFGAGTALGGVPLLAFLIWRRRKTTR
ncbi:hypothetical protein [Actinomadura rudentiformis]|uniref:TPM domain-containing protein n=1 Tax=Actinomadura rudentiformis TaxID=359158 RepID=A0A6H9YLA0_9ACTN|nr:hypothetical protein [Actinomadura rudentiformis]KAB2346491.1 hypothetical protein F8566_23860 [Actinomadura rudentiformis]